MDILVILIPLALLLGMFFIGSFFWAAYKGQYDDLETPARKILFEDENININIQNEQKKGEIK
jgi:cbb3-type cytochrome oxidase maturation protein